MSNRHHSGIAQRGLTLIELMVALTIGLFLVGAVSALFVNTRNGFDYSNEVARIQETGRFALEAIGRDIRMAGYNGCGRTVQTANVVIGSSGNPLLNFSTPIRGYEGGVDPLPTALTSIPVTSTTRPPVSGSDVLILIGASNGDIVVQSHNPPAAQINTNIHSIQPGEILLITDCSKASIFQMTGPTNNNNNATNLVHNTGTGTPGNCTKFLGASCPGASSYTYKPGSMMLRLSSSAYFIGNSTLDNGTRSLYVMELENATGGASSARELLVGVQDMQITYGLDTDGDGTANSMGNSATAITASNAWSQVISVQVSLTVRSTRTNISTTGGALTQTFTETVVARNRTL